MEGKRRKPAALIFVMTAAVMAAAAFLLPAERTVSAAQSAASAVEDTDAAAQTAASGTESVSSEKKTGWVVKKQNVYYYNAKGKKVRGLQKIGGKTYYFDSKGVQRTGWQKIGQSYYYFRIGTKAKGYMLVSRKVNGITLRKNGKAKTSGGSLAKLKVLVRANKVLEFCTKPTMSKEEKLRKLFDYTLKNYAYRGSPVFNNSADWDITYANQMFLQGHGSCYAYGAVFAYLANAAGAQAYVVSSGGHGWAEVDGKVCDPSWTLVEQRDYFMMSYSLSGKDGRPNYQRERYIYRIKI